jgi:rRNA maturation endonuclease Nob1
MAKYVCKNCNYQFELEDKSECKFCGMEHLELEKSAGELLKEIGSLFE